MARFTAFEHEPKTKAGSPGWVTAEAAMSDSELNQAIEQALRLTVAEQARLLERVAANLAREVSSVKQAVLADTLVGGTFEVWSPQDEGGAVVALNQALEEHRRNKSPRDGE